MSVATLIVGSLVSRIGGVLTAYHLTERDDVFANRVAQARVTGEAGPQASAFSVQGRVIAGEIVVAVPEGGGDTGLSTKVDAVLARIEGWTPTAAGFLVTPIRVTAEQTNGNQNGMRLWRLTWGCLAISSTGDGLITAKDADVELEPETDLNVVGYSLEEGVAPRQGTRLARDSYGSVKAGMKYGRGQIIFSGDDWPPAARKYDAVFTLRTGVTKSQSIFLSSYRVLLDAGNLLGAVFFVCPFSFTYDDEITA